MCEWLGLVRFMANRRGAEYSHPPTPNRYHSLIYSNLARNRKMCATVSEAELYEHSRRMLYNGNQWLSVHLNFLLVTLNRKFCFKSFIWYMERVNCLCRHVRENIFYFISRYLSQAMPNVSFHLTEKCQRFINGVSNFFGPI